MDSEKTAEKMTATERSQKAKKAAQARWDALENIDVGSLAKATHQGTLTIVKNGPEIPCAVLQDGTRLLSSRGFLKALGRPWRGVYKSDRTNMPNFLAAKNLQPFISDELRAVLNPVTYLADTGSIRTGYKAELLPMVCDVYLKARDAKSLTWKQVNNAHAYDILMRGLAHVGIIALVDEATGFQADRARDALAKILEKFIVKELRAWTKTFPVEFYEQIFRLKDWRFDQLSSKRPGVIGHYTNNFIYRRLAPGVLAELRKKNPTVDGRRKTKHFQWLTGDVGHPKLRSHIDGVLALMRASGSFEEFKKLLNNSFPLKEEADLGFEIEYTDD